MWWIFDSLFGEWGAVIVAELEDRYTHWKMKRRLQTQLGRKVADHELVSIRAWMHTPKTPEEQKTKQAPRRSERVP